MKFLNLTTIIVTAAMSCAATLSSAQTGSSTLEAVKERGVVKCISNSGYPGFGYLEEDGSFSGFDVDWCSAFAAAIFGDSEAYEIRPAAGSQRFTLLVSNEGDVGVRSTTWTLSRDTTQGVNFLSPYYYDGQGFIVRKSDGISNVADLDGATICIFTGTTSELNVADALAAAGVSYQTSVFDDEGTLWTAYETGQCESISSDRSYLASYSKTNMGNPDDHVVLADIISKEPLAPYVRNDDASWGKIIRWIVAAAINAEEMGITSENIDQVRADTTDPRVQRFMGDIGDLGTNLGLPADFAYQVIKQIGNYGEIYSRNLGEESNFNLARGKNALHTEGGLIYAPPMR